jgi:integrase
MEISTKRPGPAPGKRQHQRLSSLGVRNLKDPGFYPDGNGLFLKVTAKGNKTWHFRFKLVKRPREMGLGSYPAVSLKQARSEAEEARKLIGKGIDPIEERKAQRAIQKAPKAPIFETLTMEYIEAHAGEWRNAKHKQQWRNTLATYAFPIIGKVPVDQIQLDHILKILQPIWSTKTETASRVRQRMENVLDAAIAMGHRTTSNPALWKGNLKPLLSDPSKAKKVEHHPALPYAELPNVIAELQEVEGLSARALLFTILTASRTNEVLQARWPEFDLDSGVWTIPGPRMKAGRDHRVPLSKAAVEILKPLYECREQDDCFIFPGMKPNKPLSPMAMLMTLRRMRPGLTVHGFRSTFRDWCAEETHFHPDIAEAALAHVINNKARAAYERGDKLEKRRELMEQWAKYSSNAKHRTRAQDKEK